MLATSSAYGGRINKALDKDILGACLSCFVCHAHNKIHYIVLLTGYVQSMYAVTKTILIDAVNDKRTPKVDFQLMELT